MRRHFWKIILAFSVIAIGGTAAVTSFNSAPAPLPPNGEGSASSSGAAQTICNPRVWDFVYHPNRLPQKSDCRTVSGLVEWVRDEPDGDTHIRLQLDDPNAAPVNSANIGGYLVVEPICQHPVSQADAVQSCQEYRAANMPAFADPQVGDHIQVTGFYTPDDDHGGWAEIHAVLSITKIR